MIPDHADLLARIESFDIDGGTVGFPFAARLGRENGWSRSYADRVVTEYKRFIFLAVTSDTPVCPSEDVDAAWHLHLTYTRSYWKRFCERTLGRPLHHEPTKGGPSEHEKHLAMYAGTLARYRGTFGHDAPADIWSSTAERFGSDLAHRTVNTTRNWVIPKAPVKRVARLAVAFVAVAAFVPGCEGGLNPFALHGSEFLAFLIPMIVAAVCVGRVLRSMQRGPEPTDNEEEPALSWEESAYLIGGSARLTTATIARLVACGAAKIADQELVRGAAELPEATAVERTVLRALPVTNSLSALGPVVKAVETEFTDGARKLEEAGLLMTTTQRVNARFIAIVPLLIVMLGFALPRFLMGMANGKPVEYLVVTSVFGLVIGLGVAQAGRLWLTRRGERVEATLKARHRALLNQSLWDGTGNATMAVALFGTAALIGTELADLQAWYPRPTALTSSGCGSGGCSSGAGGCGGGGGGCGGGGCGGCGGGD
jgi:uncharacterized protein (TIGR04222 family)